MVGGESAMVVAESTAVVGVVGVVALVGEKGCICLDSIF